MSECLGKIKPVGMSVREAEKALMTHALGDYKIPGEPGFPAGMGFEAPRDRGEAETLRAYLGQVRQELAGRLLERVYDGQAGERGPSKVCHSFKDTLRGAERRKERADGLQWWLSFTKRRFMGKTL